MDYNTAKRTIEEIERDIRVCEIRYNGKHIWPILKYHFFFGLIKPEKSSESTSAAERPPFRPTIASRIKHYTKEGSDLFICYIRDLFERQKLKKKGTFDILFIDVTDAEYIEEKDGKKYSHYISPYISFFKKNASLLFLNTYPERSRFKEKYEQPYHYNSQPFLKYREIILRQIQKRRKGTREIINDKALKDDLADRNILGVYNKEQLLDVFTNINRYEKLWLKILPVIKPKIVFLECYYGNENYYGLLSAARQMGIKTVDIQHGTSHHSMYTGWINPPADGYEYLPDYYWCWSQYDAENIKNSRNGSTVFPPLVGGNLWLNEYFHEKEKNKSNTDLPEHLIKNKEKIILVTLQHSIPVSHILIDAIKSSPKNWQWLIRFHPLDYIDPSYRRTYIDLLSGITNVEYKLTTDANLYDIIPIANVHITHHSTSAIEAITFQVPTILLGNKFEKIFKEFIDNGHFYIAETAEKINRLIEENIEINPETLEYYKIQYSSDQASSALSQLLKN